MKKNPTVELKLPVLKDMELVATQSSEVIAKHMNLSEEKCRKLDVLIFARESLKFVLTQGRTRAPKNAQDCTRAHELAPQHTRRHKSAQRLTQTHDMEGAQILHHNQHIEVIVAQGMAQGEKHKS